MYKHLTTDELLRHVTIVGDPLHKELAARLESLENQINELVIKYENEKPGEPYQDHKSMFHKKQAD